MGLPAPVGCALIRFALVGVRIGAVLFCAWCVFVHGEKCLLLLTFKMLGNVKV